MYKQKIIIAALLAGGLISGLCSAQNLEDNWNDFLHYTLIGRLDMAKGYAQLIMKSNPDPVKLLELMEDNPQAYHVLLRAKENIHDPNLANLAGKLWDTIEQGRFIRRSEPKVIVEEIQRLSTTERGFLMAVKRLKNSGEYAIPYMLKALADRQRQDEWENLIRALPKIGRDAIRPLAAALQTKDNRVKAEIIKALGEIAYPQSLAYLKFVNENEKSVQLRQIAEKSIKKINPNALNQSAAELFFSLGENYYYHADSLAPAEDADFANIWFWDHQKHTLIKERVDRSYFNELMAMRSCEWSLKADPAFGSSISLWLAAFFKAEACNIEMPVYFRQNHPDAMTYATTAGPQYLHQALARAIDDKNAYVALGTVEALIVNAGEKSLFYRLGTEQPLVLALSFNDRAVRYSAAIAIAGAGPVQMFPQRKLVVKTLAEALHRPTEDKPEDIGRWNEELAYSYALRSADVMLKLAKTRNPVLNLLETKNELVNAAKSEQPDEIQVLAGQILAHLDNPLAQRAIADMALSEENKQDIRIRAFESLAVSAKLNANLLDSESIDRIYSIVSSTQANPELRAAAAAAFGALNLPSQKVKNLILEQAQS